MAEPNVAEPNEEVLYMTRCPILLGSPWKLGRWRGTIPALRARYMTTSGPNVDLRVFPCPLGMSVALEHTVFKSLKAHRLFKRHELFDGSTPELEQLYVSRLETATCEPMAFLEASEAETPRRAEKVVAVARRTDEALITAVMAVHPELHKRVCFSPDTKTATCGGLFYCDPTTNVWQQRHNIVMEEMLVGMFKSLPDLSASDKRHIESRRGRADMVHMLAAKSVDEHFRERLDADPDLFALSSSCLATGGPETTPKFKDLEPEDYVFITTGWEYSREQAVAARPELEDFLTKVLPVPEERRVVLAYFASLLSGRRIAKKILVMTETSMVAHCGKSWQLCCQSGYAAHSLVALMGSFFGGYAQLSKGAKFVCKGSVERDACLELSRGKRLVVAEELNSSMVLDVALLKRMAGGAGVLVGGGDAERNSSQFLWQAGIVLIFNEGDLPSYDQDDLAFRDRLLFVPMRSQFVKALPQQSPTDQDKWTFEADLGVCARFSEWRSALADVLVEHYGVEGSFEQPPHSMTA